MKHKNLTKPLENFDELRPETWYHRCLCGYIMMFNKKKYTYYCTRDSCPNILEI